MYYNINVHKSEQVFRKFCGVVIIISYEPLFKTLEEKKLVISSLRNNPLHPTTIAKIYKNESVSLSKIEEICLVLNVPIEKVVKISRDK